jgi:hypothetical protein
MHPFPLTIRLLSEHYRSKTRISTCPALVFYSKPWPCPLGYHAPVIHRFTYFSHMPNAVIDRDNSEAAGVFLYDQLVDNAIFDPDYVFYDTPGVFRNSLRKLILEHFCEMPLLESKRFESATELDVGHIGRRLHLLALPQPTDLYRDRFLPVLVRLFPSFKKRYFLTLHLGVVAIVGITEQANRQLR